MLLLGGRRLELLAGWGLLLHDSLVVALLLVEGTQLVVGDREDDLLLLLLHQGQCLSHRGRCQLGRHLLLLLLLILQLLENVLLVVKLGVRLDVELGLLDQVVEHGLEFEDAGGVARVHQLHGLLQVEHAQIGEGRLLLLLLLLLGGHRLIILCLHLQRLVQQIRNGLIDKFLLALNLLSLNLLLLLLLLLLLMDRNAIQETLEWHAKLLLCAETALFWATWEGLLLLWRLLLRLLVTAGRRVVEQHLNIIVLVLGAHELAELFGSRVEHLLSSLLGWGECRSGGLGGRK